MSTKPLAPSSLISTSQACKLLGITRQTLYSWMETGRIEPWMKVEGATWLFERRHVEELKGVKYQREKKASS